MRPQWAARRGEISFGVAGVASMAIGAALGLTLTIVIPHPEEQTTGIAETAKRPARSVARPPHPGLLIDRRDESLRRLLAAPGDIEAMNSLVRIQRVLASDNPKVLRLNAAVYAQAVRAGAPDHEHLSPQAMRLLVLANLLGATQIESQTAIRGR